jgi:hypothetical protein
MDETAVEASEQDFEDDEEDGEEDMVSENGGGVSEGLGSAVNVETVAEEMARKVTMRMGG